jgi:hypothetical protein
VPEPDKGNRTNVVRVEDDKMSTLANVFIARSFFFRFDRGARPGRFAVCAAGRLSTHRYRDDGSATVRVL